MDTQWHMWAIHAGEHVALPVRRGHSPVGAYWQRVTALTAAAVMVLGGIVALRDRETR